MAEIKVLDKGVVKLIDSMGNDDSIAEAARVSNGEGTKQVSTNEQLIRYLLRHKHTSPFEMVELKFYIKAPIFVARQWMRHRTASINEISGRYSIMKDETYVPEVGHINYQSAVNNQGRGEVVNLNDAALFLFNTEMDNDSVFHHYHKALDMDIARELARINLPLSLYTEFYWKIDLWNLFHFLRLRLDSHAQYEIRCYGEAIADIIKTGWPVAYEAFEDYILFAETFSAPELKELARLLGNLDLDTAVESLSGREANEFREKLKKLIEV